ncbi:MAG: single-stranded-DNA-specific exonuclease RecJ [Bacteroidales bacterium]|nr:single-stranded-DNA-specific exonuclease RecJ [Bacteroidales bacterium]
MKEKHWIIRQDYDLETVENLAASLGVDRIIATLLVERGVTTFEEARRFFRPGLDQIHDPFLMKGMRQAIDRINKAIENRERIMVYGDYDVDGTSAVALVFSYFKELNRNIDFYIPDREREGYGISTQGIDYARETGVKLIIALDCGIKAMEQVDYAAKFGIDFIIGDHHLPGDEVPRAVAVLDPKQADCPYPYKELSGCGIGFKIVEAHLEERMGVRLCDMPEQLDAARRQRQEELKLHLLKYLDLVAVSIASDIVPIMGENRVLAFFGLRVLNTKPRPGIEAILKYGHVDKRQPEGDQADAERKNGYFEKELTISDLVFLVGPRINAAGRIRSAFDSVRLMLTEDPNIARQLADDINSYNLERKDLDTSATEEAKRRIDTDPFYQGRQSLVLYDPSWHRGVVGIVASRIVEAYNKPTIVFTEGSDGLITGSARSLKEFDVHEALEKCADLLEHFGGHKSAAGVSLRKENMRAFLDRFEGLVREGLGSEEVVPEVEVDAEIGFSQITPKFLRILKQFAPFGPDNNVPVFVSRELVDTGNARIVGTNHLKFNAIPIAERTSPYPAIAFQQGEALSRMRRGELFDLCYQLEENYWRGRTEIQLNIKDIKFEE